MKPPFRVAVFGLGYVGCVTAACLASRGHTVRGIDVDALKLKALRRGRSPIIEHGLPELIREAVDGRRLEVMVEPAAAVGSTDISMVCVGTPSQPNGSLDLRFARRVAQEIGDGLRMRPGYHVVAFRSTMLPGSVETELLPLLEERSGKRCGPDFGVVYNPEFMREGSAVADFFQPSRTLIGEVDRRAGDRLARLYADIDAPLVRTSVATAEMIKYVDNAFHALKVSFANEVGSLCRAEGVDGSEVMDIFCLDRKLNLAPKYLTPGAPFGGSCLPKDVRALVYRSKMRDMSTPLLDAILTSNERHKQRVLEMVMSHGRKRIGLLGLSFKPGTDDLRESPTVQLVEALIGKGYQVAIYDEDVSLARVFGSNRAYIEHEIPHIASLMRPRAAEVVREAEVLILANRDPRYDADIQARPSGQVLIDLAGLSPELRQGLYGGIGW